MKNTSIITLLLILNLLFVNDLRAQTGWQWGLVNSGGHCMGWMVKSDSAGNLYTATQCSGPAVSFGSYTISNPAYYNMLTLAKASATGHYLWAIAADSTNSSAVGIAADKQGNTYVLGAYDSSICIFGSYRLLNPSYKKMYFLSKVSPTGTVLWTKNVGGYTDLTITTLPNHGFVGLDDSGNVYISSEFKRTTMAVDTFTLVNHDPTGATTDIFVAKYDNNGNVKWAKAIGGRNTDMTAGLAVSPVGNIYMAIRDMSDTIYLGGVRLVDSIYSYTRHENYALAKMDHNGSIGFARKYATFYRIISSNVALDMNENIYMAGMTRITTDDFYMAKYDSAGNFLWANAAVGWGTTADNEATDIAVDLCGHVWITGYIGNNMTFGTDTLLMPTADVGLFIAGYDTSGTYLTSDLLTTGYDGFYGITVDNQGNLVVAGTQRYWVTIPVGRDTLSITAISGSFIGKYKYDTAFCIRPPEGTLSERTHVIKNYDVALFPNPATYECTIASPTPFVENSAAYVYDITGRLIDKISLTGTNTVFPIAHYAPGMYQCTIVLGDGHMVVKKLAVIK